MTEETLRKQLDKANSSMDAATAAIGTKPLATISRPDLVDLLEHLERARAAMTRVAAAVMVEISHPRHVRIWELTRAPSLLSERQLLPDFPPAK